MHNHNNHAYYCYYACISQEQREFSKFDKFSNYSLTSPFLGALLIQRIKDSTISKLWRLNRYKNIGIHILHTHTKLNLGMAIY